MSSEEELDALLDERMRGRAPRGPVSRDVAPLLSTAARLDPLREATPSSAFAADLERRLLAHMADRSALPTEKLLAQPPLPQPQRRLGPIHLSQRAAWAAIAAALLLVAGLGALTAQAAPGAPLYVVRQLAQTLAAKALPSPTQDPQASLAQARADLAAFDTAIASANAPAALGALNKLRADDAETAQRIADVSDDTTRQAEQTQLTDFRQGAASDLRASLPSLDWQARAQVTSELRAWGNANLVVTDARILPDTAASQGASSAASGSASGSLLIEARGAGFVTGSQLLVNGQPSGEIISLSPTQITVRVTANAVSFGASGSLVIGVENPDNTVAMTTHVEREDQGNGSDTSATPGVGDHTGDQTGTATPGADATHTPDATRTPSPDERQTPTPVASGTPSATPTPG